MTDAGDRAPVAPSSPAVERDFVSWEELDRLIGVLADQVRGEFDLILAISRGGLVPAGMIAYRLGIRDILVAAVEYYGPHDEPGAEPRFLQFPSNDLLRDRRILVVDEVWDSGSTIRAVTERVRAAGGHPTTAVLHYKPGRSRVPETPDHHAATADAWVVYPFKGGG